LNVEGRFDLRPNVKYPHLGATTLPNLGAKLHLGAIRNELSEMRADMVYLKYDSKNLY
jgi:hypothetical protein